jgi:hypothetical protein
MLGAKKQEGGLKARPKSEQEDSGGNSNNDPSGQNGGIVMKQSTSVSRRKLFALAVVGWLCALGGWVIPSESTEQKAVKVVLLAAARVLP